MSVLSANDWQKIAKPNPEQRVPDWRRFEKPSTAELVAAEERNREEQERPIREAEAALTETGRKLFELEKGEVVAGRRDLSFTIPDSVAGKSMTLDEVREFNNREAAAFVSENPNFYRSQRNREIILDYLFNQGVMIADKSCFAQAVERLRHFGLLEEKPVEPEPEPTPVAEPQIELEPQQEDLVDGFDPISGQPRKFTQAEIWKMSSSDMKKVFKMWTDRDGTDRRARFRSAYH